MEVSNSSDNGTFSAPSLAFTVSVSVILGLVAITTILGNLLVIVATIRSKHLHTMANKLVASLAATDCLVAILVMPLSIVYSASDRWPFGEIMCDFFLTMDIMCCTASILHLVAISIDRYFAVTSMGYQQSEHLRNFIFAGMIGAAWLTGAAICVPPLFLWDHDYKEGVCHISPDLTFTIYSTATAFYIPMACLIFIYTRLFMKISESARKAGQGDANNNNNANGKKNRLKKREESSSGSSGDTGGETTVVHVHYQTEVTCAVDKSSSSHSVSLVEGEYPTAVVEANSRTPLKSVSPTLLQKPSGQSDKKKKQKRHHLAKRERKVLRILVILTGVFLACWLPFFIMAVVIPFCGDKFDPLFIGHIMNVATWLGYLNSTLNPILYTVFSMDYRRAFKSLLISWCPSCCSGLLG